MSARNPRDVDLLVIEALNAGDVEAAVALYERDATFVPEPGKLAAGQEAIREAINGFLALKPRLTIEVTQVVESGDLALLASSWTLKGTAPDGTPIEMASHSAEVVRRQPDGTWKFVIDNPFAGASS